MKKNYFMLAAATMMFAACAETDLVNEIAVEETPQAISFETFAQKATRAELTDVTLKTAGFQVWGYKAPTADPMDWSSQYTVFNNVSVSYDNTKSIWNSAVTKYWDRTSTYKFYAAAPASDAAYYSIAPATGMITITGAGSAKSTASKDYLIDRDGKNVDGAYSGTEHTAVEFDFHHIMSKLSFELKAAVPADIVVTRLVMTGWNSGNGTFVQTLTATPTSADNYSEWTIPTAGEGSVTLVGTGANDATIELPKEGTEKPVADKYIMVPQIITPSTLTFTIDFMIGDEVFTAQVGKLASQQIWGTDAHTTYTISVGPDVIDFNVTNVCGWDAGAPNPEPEIE